MKSIVVQKDLSLALEDNIPVPGIDDCQVLVKVEAGGICAGTDMKIVHGTMKGIDKNTYPALLGHESVGIVEKKGKHVKQFSEGDRVLLPFISNPPAGYASYYGGLSEYGVCTDWMAMVEQGKGPGTPYFDDSLYTQKSIPKSFDPVESTMIVTFREVLAAARGFGLAPNESVVIFGAGPVGMSFVRFAKLMGLAPVICVDISDEKIKDAYGAGADIAINSSSVDVVAEIRRELPDGADHIIDAVGITSLINQAMKLVKPNGQICVYGISPNLSMDLSWAEAPYNWRLYFMQWPVKGQEAAAHSQIINWIECGVLDPKDFISHVFPYEEALKGFDILEKKSEAYKKIVITF